MVCQQRFATPFVGRKLQYVRRETAVVEPLISQNENPDTPHMNRQLFISRQKTHRDQKR